MRRIHDDRHNNDIWRAGVMPYKFFEFLVRHFNVVRTSAIHKADDLAFDLKNKETIGIDLDSLCYLFEGSRFVAFIGISLDLKASNCIRGLGVSNSAHAFTL